MTTTKVLVTGASRRGSTMEIAEAIADTLRGEGLDTDLRLLQEVVDLAPYHAVVLGSAVYAFRWRPKAVRFLKHHRKALAKRSVWLFQSGPLDRSAEEHEIPLPKKVAPLAERICVRGHATFGGMLSPDASGFVASKMAKNGKGGDFRNFDQIRAWAHEVASQLRSQLAA
jgi:menaquinone-dependent protoporphyrinogen oxidase